MAFQIEQYLFENSFGLIRRKYKLGLKFANSMGILPHEVKHYSIQLEVNPNVTRVLLLCLVIMSLSVQLVGRQAFAMTTTAHHTDKAVHTESDLHDLMHFLAEPHTHNDQSEDGFSLDDSAEGRLHVFADLNFSLQLLLPMEQSLVALPRTETALFYIPQLWNSLPPDGLRRPPRF